VLIAIVYIQLLVTSGKWSMYWYSWGIVFVVYE